MGSDEWNNFVYYARKYALTEKEDYPNSNDHCILCRQELSKDALKLVKQIWGYLSSKSNTDLESLSNKLTTILKTYKQFNVDIIPQTSIHFKYLEKNNPDLLARINESVKQYCLYIEELTNSIELKKVVKKKLELRNYDKELKKTTQVITDKLSTLLKENYDKKISNLNEEKTYLEHKKLLNVKKKELINYIQRIKWLSKAKRLGISTRHITNKYDELFDNLVTKNYVNTFEGVMSDFGVDIKVEIRTKPVKGNIIKQVALTLKNNNTNYSNIAPEKILSDGEKRTVALTDFLTEAIMNKGCHTVVLDDPVVAIDLDTKIRIAEWLAKRSKSSQVIIFTHDILFLYYLDKYSQSERIDTKHHWVDRDSNNSPGYISLDDSPALEKQYKSAQKAREYYGEAKNETNRSKSMDKVKHGFSALRSSYEYLIVYKLLAGVVVRFEERINFTNLKDVVTDEGLLNQVVLKMGEISRYIDAHLPSNVVGRIPTKENLLKEIEEYEKIRKKVK